VCCLRQGMGAGMKGVLRCWGEGMMVRQGMEAEQSLDNNTPCRRRRSVRACGRWAPASGAGGVNGLSPARNRHKRHTLHPQ
jgi:hypothetical protein